MALKPFNSIGGFSVGETPSNVILANGDITTTNITTTGVSNLNSVANVRISGGTVGQVIQTDGNGNLSFATIGTASLSNGNSNVTVLNNGNINFSVAGNANVATITGVGANFNGNVAVTGLLTNNLYYANGTVWDLQEAAGANTQIQYNNGTNNNFGASANFTFNDATNVFTVNGNANVGNLGTAQVLASANVTAPQLISNVANGTAPFVVTSTTQVANLSVATAGSATTAGTVTTAAQPNITSVGNLTSLDVTGNLSAGNANLGNLAIANFVQGTLTTAAQPNITSVGLLTGLTVGNATANTVFGNGTIEATGNFSAGNANLGNAATANFFFGAGNNLSNIQGANVSGTVSAATTAGTVTTNAQPNITSVGTLTSLDVTGNVASNNFTGANLVSANFVTGTLTTAAQPNITSVGTLGNLNVTNTVDAGNVVTNAITGKTTGVTITATGTNQNITLVPTGTGTVNVGNFVISNVATPVNPQDATNKQYVDEVAQGLVVKAACQAATYEPLATSTGGTITYNNGTSGVGATLTVAGGTFGTIDGVALANGSRVLVKNEATAANNGIYVRTSTTVLTRTADFDNTPSGEIAGAFTFIQGGTINGDTGWVCTTDNPVTMGTTAINFSQFSGAGSYTAGTGLTLTGTVFSITNTTVTAASYGGGDAVATFTVNAQGQLTAASNVAITANAANLTGTTLNSGVVTSSLTSVGTLGSLSVTGNITSGNVYANSGTIGASLLTGTLTTAAQPNVTSVGTLTVLDVNGNITAANITANTGVFTGNGAGLTNIAGANVTGTVANATFATSSGTAGTVTTNAQPNITSVGTLTSLSVTGNISGGNVSATSGNLTTANVTGNVIIGSTTVTFGTVTTTATTAAQTIASFPVSGTTGIEYLVKGVDSAGAKYSVAKVVAVTDGTAVDYTVFATVNIGTVTGSSLQVVVDTGNLKLQVTPASSNSTVWTTQYNLV